MMIHVKYKENSRERFLIFEEVKDAVDFVRSKLYAPVSPSDLKEVQAYGTIVEYKRVIRGKKLSVTLSRNERFDL